MSVLKTRSGKTLAISALLLAMWPASLPARQLSLEEALNAAGRMTPASGIRKAPAANACSLEHTVKEGDINTVYLVNNGNSGYMLLAADDVATPLLGYSDNGAVSFDSIPPSMKEWISEYSRQIAAAVKSGGRVAGAPRALGRESLPPLVLTRWNQDSPYNNQCPTLNGRATYTGCVATAMAQVMKSHRWPEQPSGSNSYDWSKGGKTLSMSFDGITFDWDNMCDRYTGSETYAQKNAVATLMKCCGYAAQMNYGTDASGANSLNATAGLVNNLGYDKGVRYLSRDNYSLSEWTDMLYDELLQGYPLYYDGSGTGGHAFVIDGYNEPDGFFHVNWGWGGQSDGYFQITTLDPDSQGIGGSTAGYYNDQGAIFNLRRPQAGSDYYYQMVVNGEFLTQQASYTRSGSVTFLGGTNDLFFNQSIATIDTDLGLKLVSTSGEVSYVWRGYYSTLGPNYGYRAYSISAGKFPQSGTYTVTPAFRLKNGQIYDAKVSVKTAGALKLVASSSRLVFSPVDETSNLVATNIQISPFYTNNLAQITATVTNKGNKEYYGNVYAAVYKNGQQYVNFPKTLVDIMPGRSENILTSANIGDVLPEGAYQVGVMNADNKLISELIDMQVKPAPTVTPAIKMTGIPRFTWSLGGSGTSVNDPALVFSRQLKMEADITCTQGYYTGNIYGYVFPMSGGSSSTCITSPEFHIEAGQTKTIPLDGDVSKGMETGSKYKVQFRHKHSSANTLSSITGAPVSMYVHVTGTTGVEGVSAEEATAPAVTPNPASDVTTVTCGAPIREIEIYSIAGSRMAVHSFPGDSGEVTLDVSALPAGHYILRIATAGGSSVTRLIKR